ncbi:DEAD/DEAH box helicase [Thalassospira australica]|uniref:DEAD/DEAH box helicase n=1 Tax=Thalassospira australica TaxID=1528106 RepID=UPI00051A36EB|nr:AAA domain-containing protein [Thalassospira australica]
MKNRPYFNKSIKELEKTFNDNQSDSETLNRLIHELGFRSTQRALALKKQVQATNACQPANSAPQKSLRTPEPKANQLDSAPREPALPFGEPPKACEAIKQPETIKMPGKAVAKPPITNDAQDILRAWTALEVLSPQGYRRETDLVAGDRKKIARFEEGPLPWELGEKSLPKKRLYYELILGAIELAPAVETLLKVYADKRPDKPSMRGASPIASILLDKEGHPLDEETSVAISSFAWGVPIALQGDLKKLADWPAQEKLLKGQFRKLLVKRDRNDDVVPLTKSRISELFEYLVAALNLHGHVIKAPYFALRRYEFFASKTPPEPGLLNSFFLGDLAAASVLASTGKLPNALEHYLGVKTPSQRINLLEDNAGLRDLLQPALTPPGKWPGKGRFPLALLQQAAVNATNAQQIKTGVLAVNGPPGTGKTTLLRDVVAARLIERAAVMHEFNRPSQAFTPTREILQRSGAKITLHKLDERLKGFEMVVTSSNNKAVENVSAELPVIDAIAVDAPELRYFKSISDNVLERDTWGVIAAVLGNSSNRYMFSQRFWRDEENGLSTYLNHASGVPQIVSESQGGGLSPLKRNRQIIDRERPPSNTHEAQVRWEKARSKFKTKFDALKRTENSLQELHVQLVRYALVAAEINNLAQELPSLEVDAQNLESERGTALHEQREAESRFKNSRQVQISHFSSRPGFFARLLRTARFRTWRDEQQGLSNRTGGDQQRFHNRKKTAEDIGAELAATKELIAQKRESLDTLRAEKTDLEASLQHACGELDVPIPDDDFFAGAHEDIQTASVWFDNAASRQRDDVFEAAIQLHHAFIDAAADPLRQNLSVFVETFGTRSLGTPQKDVLIADLWSSFFLVVPVVSTTFASVNRMFSRLPTEALGWLLVDEAGQAVPQAAVGAMMRTKRSVVVGDPLQIEPVVTLPNSLTEEVCAFFGIDPLKYNAPEGSVQTVADAASMYCAKFPIGSGHRDVGSPLLVHRRCDSPMFDISNEIAYSNLMVQAKAPSTSNPVLGHSCWIDVVGKSSSDKWCADEGEVLIKMLRELRSSGARADLYVVTPFVVVQDNLRQAILRSGVLSGWVDKPDDWVWEHVGTVHTVQGREAAIVFFVLGAQDSSQNGARNWAGSKPNLVNVAVTRAKASLYVIGNRSLWKTAGVFSVLDRYLSD